MTTIDPQLRAVALSDTISVALVRVTPELADQWLLSNVRNRRLSNKQVTDLTGAIQRAEWVFNGQAIVFDALGNLADGQNRLTAISKAGIPVDALVVWGVQPLVAQDTQDRNTRRTLKSQLEMRGEKNVKTLASAILFLYRLRCGTMGGTYAPTVAQGLALLAECPAIRESVTIGNRVARPPVRYSAGLGAALHFVFADVDQDDADTFFARLEDGAGLAERDPIFVLRNRMMVDASRAGGRQGMVPRYRAAITIKAWNAWRAGQEVGTLKFSPGGSTPEAFPRWDDDVAGGA